MTSHNLRAKIALTAGALAFVGLASVPAFAQEYHYPVGRNVNDGGMTASVGGGYQPGGYRPAPQAYYNYAPGAQPQYHYPVGRGVNDGGMTTVAANARMPKATPAKPLTPHFGRNVNDGGLTN